MPDIALVEAHDVDALSAPPLVSTTLQADAYVLLTAALPAYYAASTSLPSNAIHLLDRPSLRTVHILSGHNHGTTDLRSVSSVAGNTRDVLVSSGKDGTVKVWDERAPSPAVITMTPAGRSRALLCCDVSPNGLTVAAGSELSGDEALILYWDPRHPAAPLRTHSSTHSDDVTAVHFSPSHHRPTTSPYPVLLSASSDGLIATSDPSEDDEDESVQHVANWGCSVAQVGWTPPQLRRRKGATPCVWAASDMETFSTWSNELDPLLSVDIRSPSVHSQQRTWVTDYFITCPTTTATRQTTHLDALVGSNEGDVALISVPSDPTSSTWTLHRQWTHGHVGVVRSALYDEDNGILLTGGEDSKINLWSCPPLPSDQVDDNSLDSGSSDSDRKMDVDSQDSSGTRKRARIQPTQLDHQDIKKPRMSD